MPGDLARAKVIKVTLIDQGDQRVAQELPCPAHAQSVGVRDISRFLSHTLHCCSFCFLFLASNRLV
jgi:hypothetical protein